MNFFVLCKPKRTKFKNATWDEGTVYDTKVCDICGHIYESYRSDLFITLENDRIGDIVWTWYGECVITQRVLDILKSNKLTGYYVKPVTITNIKTKSKRPNVLPPLWELIPNRSFPCDNKSGICVVKHCNTCGRKDYTPFIKGFSIDESIWDKSDLFSPKGYDNFVITTESVKNLFEESQISNCSFVPALDINKLFYSKEEIKRGYINNYKIKSSDELFEWCNKLVDNFEAFVDWDKKRGK
jgi:hypothetical protein